MATSLRTGLVALVLAIAPLAVGCVAGDEESSVVSVEMDSTQSAGRFEIFVGEDDQHYFSLIAANGEKVLRSEGYATFASCEDGIESVQMNGRGAGGYELLEASNGEWYFNVVAPNGQIVGTSELYVSKYNAERGISTVMGILTATETYEPAPTGTPRFFVFKGQDNKYYFNLRAANGQIVLQSQGYVQRSSALNGIQSVLTNGVLEQRYELHLAQNDQYFFTLEAANYQVIAHGETYVSLSNAERAVDRLIVILGGTVHVPQ
jgi:uncharacterized protein YegP (UPF0339 family)